ncbi:hypothetical protein EWM64_g8616 [Hericium alpestre]|uniref:ER membrane protein complex subunit 10 n=1 Tax=Hericium alpestre TaxID=135208 RepID=A0A4Y9ZPG3_9AGAM|nr:hypothetical protein EWM64_g8616 [Hericium alpestre]
MAALLLFLVPAVHAFPLSLYHRIYHPSLDSDQFFNRGVLDIDRHGQVSFQPAAAFAADLLSFAEASDPLHDALYQIALPSSSAADDAPWHISSVKACHLSGSSIDSIVLHSAEPGSLPYALDYFVAPIPHDARCPAVTPKSSPVAVASRNTSVDLSFPRQPPLPELRAPPPLSPQGQPVKPAEEKPFLQKYWMYIALLLGVMMFAPGRDEGEGAGQGGRQ